jgi:phage gp16-like protein
MLEQHGLQLVTLTAPSNFPVKPAETARNARLKKAKEFTVATLRDWVAAELESMASRFDSRLGTPVFRARIQKFRDAVQYAVQHPLENPAGTPQT